MPYRGQVIPISGAVLVPSGCLSGRGVQCVRTAQTARRHGDKIVAWKSRSPLKPRPATYRRKAFEITGAVALLGVVVAIALWLEADVLHKTTNGDGLANLVLVALVAVYLAAGLLVGPVRRGARVALNRMRHWRRHA